MAAVFGPPFSFHQEHLGVSHIDAVPSENPNDINRA